MRVDFLASFQQVKGLIDARPAPLPEGGTDFGKTLGDLLPKPTEPIGKIDETKAARQSLPPPGPGPMASIRFAEPLLRSQPLEGMLGGSSPQVAGGEGVKEAGLGVKTPNILELKRIPSAREYAALPRKEQLAVVEKLVQAAGEKAGIDPLLGMAVASAESAFNTHAVSGDGYASKGLFQLLDSTGKHLIERSELDEEYTPFEPGQNVALGVNYLRHLHDVFSAPTTLGQDLKSSPAANSTSLEKLAVAAFNAGEGRVAFAQQQAEKAGKSAGDYSAVAPYLPESTQEYVERVIQNKARLQSRFVG